MIVVSDTTPIHYLILIGKESILPHLFDEIIIPQVVVEEMSHLNAPDAVKAWANSMPNWAAVRLASEHLTGKINGLGKGETAAIAIAIEIGADAILMNDRQAVREATNNGLNILTTFALLELASKNSLIDFASSIEELSKTSFHLPPEHIVKAYLLRNR